MKAESIVQVGFSGAGGYGYYYLQRAFKLADQGLIAIGGVFDPRIDQLSILKDLRSRNIVVHTDYDSFKEAMCEFELLVIVSPIQFHVSQAIDGLKAHCNILVDKPLAGSLSQASELISAVKQSSYWVMVGYQWCFSETIRNLKKDLLHGVYGKIIRGKTFILWPRDFGYFARNNWAGRKQDENGLMINDHLVNNAMAHFVHNLLYLTGASMEEAAIIQSGEAELYRAYPIETFDTAVIEMHTTTGIELRFYGSHVARTQKEPQFIIECEGGVIYYGEISNEVVAVCKDGSVKHYGDPDGGDQFEKLSYAVQACQKPLPVICPPEAALSQTELIEALSEINDVQTFSAERITNEKGRLFVEGLDYSMLLSYQQGILPAKTGLPNKSIIQSFRIRSKNSL